MNFLCKIGLHRWKYRSRTSIFYIMVSAIEVTRYCERCERIEKGLKLSSPLPIMWEKAELRKGVEG